MLFAKSPMQMRLEAEERGKPTRKLSQPGPVDPAKLPLLDGASFGAYLRTGRAEVR